MIKSTKFPAFCLMLLSGLMLVACASGIRKADIPSTANPQDEITKLGTDLFEATSKNIENGTLGGVRQRGSVAAWQRDGTLGGVRQRECRLLATDCNVSVTPTVSIVVEMVMTTVSASTMTDDDDGVTKGTPSSPKDMDQG